MKKLDWHTEKRKVSELIGFEKNPRILTDEQKKQLIKSIEKFNLVEIPAINTDNKVIAGHQRIKILSLLGRENEEIDVRVPNRKLTEKEFEEYNIRSNKNTGEWDYDLLKAFDREMLIDVGFESDDIDNMFSDNTEDNFDVKEEYEKIKQPKAKLGDIYKLGEHRIMCGDSTNKESVEKLMNEQMAEMCFTDPPYNIDYSGGMNDKGKNLREKIANDNMNKEDFYNFLCKFISNIVATVRGGVYICMSSCEIDSLKKVWESNGGHFQSFIIWVKNHFTLSRSDYQNTYEPILYGWPKQIKNHYFIQDRSKSNVWEELNSIKTEYEDGFTTISFQGFKVKIKGKIEEGQVIRKGQKTDIWRYDKPSKSQDHPTMKPVELCTEAIINSSKINDIVLDLFLGSGSTLIACEKSKRICYGMELDTKYIDVIIARWEKLTGKKAEKIL